MTLVEKLGNATKLFYKCQMSPKKEQSRQFIVEAAFRLAVEKGIAHLTVARVATAAKLTRQAVYWHFKSRTALLLAISDYADSLLSETDALFNGRPGATALENFEFMMRVWLEQLPQAAPLLLALHAESLNDQEVRDALATRLSTLARVMRDVYLVPMQADGVLKPDLDLDRAADVLLIVGSPPVWHQMTRVLGWSDSQFADYVMQMVREHIMASRSV